MTESIAGIEFYKGSYGELGSEVFNGSPIALIEVNKSVINREIEANTGGKQQSLNFSYGDVTTQTIFQALAGQRITRVEMVFDTAFNVASSLSVGDSGNTQRLMNTGQNFPLIGGAWGSHPFHKYASNTNILLTINAGSGATQGAGSVIVYYE